MIHRILVAGLLASVLCTVPACGSSSGAIGTTCDPNNPACGSGLGCAGDPFPDNVCTKDCSDSDCPTGSVCGLIKDRSFCVPACTDRGQCRSGYQCWNGGCVPACSTNDQCGRSFQCVDGQCTPYPGAPAGSPCGDASECATRLCLDGKCALSCDRDSACPSDQTCVPSRTAAQTLSCAPRRGGAANAVACAKDGDCDRGACLLGVCVEMCATTGDCHGSSLTCTQTGLTLTSFDFQALRGCLPQTGMLAFDLPSGEYIPMPGHGRSMAIFVKDPNFDLGQTVGLTELIDPAGTTIYSQPSTEDQFYALDIRYIPDQGSSTMLVPNSPKITLMPGGYMPNAAASSFARRVDTRIFLKVAPAALSTGKADLNWYITDVGSNCSGSSITSTNAAARLATTINGIKNIYASASIDVSNVTVHGANGALTVVRASTTGGQDSGDLESVLKTATGNQPTTVGMDVTLVRSITDLQGNQVGILGIAGGIPSSPVLGTPHSGAIVSVDALCLLGQSGFAETTSHEIGHTLGLFHNVESSGRVDPLPDTNGSGQNLMYWEERGGNTISAQQGQVMRNDPKVRQ